MHNRAIRRSPRGLSQFDKLTASSGGGVGIDTSLVQIPNWREFLGQPTLKALCNPAPGFPPQADTLGWHPTIRANPERVPQRLQFIARVPFVNFPVLLPAALCGTVSGFP